MTQLLPHNEMATFEVVELDVGRVAITEVVQVHVGLLQLTNTR